jgi:BMFP domain-containing protein YqiC
MDETTSSSQDVNWQSTSTETQVDVEKLKEVEANKTIALREEREKRKALESELEELRKFKTDLDEKEKKKKWQYEELLTEKDNLINSLSEKAKKFDDYLIKLQETKTKELEVISKDIPDNLKEKYSKITDKLDLEDKIDFYKNLITDIKKEDFSNTPKSEWIEQTKANWNYSQAKSKWDILWMLKNAKPI